MPNARFRMLERATQQRPQDDATTDTRPVKFRGAGFVPGASRYGGWIGLSVVIAVWQLAGSAGWVNPLFLPTPLAICRAIYRLALSGALAPFILFADADRLGLDARYRRGRRRRLCDRAVDSCPQRRHHLHLG